MKNCVHCGNPIGAGTKFCPSCGKETAAGQASNQEFSAALEADETNKQNDIVKKSRGKLPWVIALVVLLLGGGATAAFLLNKSPKELFLLSEYHAYEQAKADFDEKYGESFEFSKKLMEQPSTSQMTLRAGLEMDSLQNDPDAAMVMEMLKNATITAKMKQDPKKNAGDYNIALNLEGEKALDMEFVHTDQQMGAKVPLLYSKFFYLNLDEYGEFMRKMDPSYTGPEKLELSPVEWKDLELKEEDVNYLTERYAAFLVDQLKDENFELEKGVEYEFKGEKMKLRKVTLSLSSQETKSLMNEYMDRLIKDKKLHSMIAVRAEKVIKAGAATEVSGEIPSREEMEEEIVNSLKEAKESLQDVEFPNGLSSVLLIDKKEQIIDRTMKMTVANPSAEEVALKIHTKNVPYGNEQRMKEFTMEAMPKENKEEKVTVQVTNDMKGKDDKRTEDLRISLHGAKEEAANFNMKSTFAGDSKGKQNIDRAFTLKVQGDAAYEVPSEISGKVKQVQDTNLDKEYSNEKLDVEVTVDDEMNGGTLSFVVDTKTKLVDKVTVPAFKENQPGSLNVNEITDEQLAQIQQEVGLNVMSLMSRFGLLGGAPMGDPFGGDSHAEDLYEEDAAAQEMFNSQSSEEEEAIF
ncbi:zinc ribbon domain-containing protein [Bacillus sp. B190/17]|uniref:Zinc ribbon domain-containing protein n=1 Tax=Bacillus lumedeiriae TaxID=3058829 RepID=A0ABW8I6P5_9BACI